MAVKTKDFRELVELMKENAAAVSPSMEANELIQKSIQRIEFLEGEYLPAFDANDNTIMAELEKHTVILGEMLEQILSLNRFMANPEFRIEDIKRQEAVLAALNMIAVNSARPAPEEKPAAEDSIIGSIGLFGTLLATALGGIAGTVVGYATYLGKMFSVAEGIVDGLVQKTMPGIKSKIGMAINTILDVVEGVSTKIKTGFAKSLDGIASAFQSLKESKAGKMIAGIADSVSDFFKPIAQNLGKIKEASKPVQAMVTKFSGAIDDIFKFFSTVGAKIGSFASIFSSVSKIVGKLFVPLTLIMSVWDTVKGAIQGFEEGGILGGIQGAIDGLVTSLITAPLDMLKDIISWALEKMGFESAAESLDSFSFTDMWDSFTDWLFNLPETIKNLFNEAVAWVQDIQIPAIGFDSPVFGRIEAGPWYPFKDDTQTKTEEAPKPAAPRPAARKPVAKPEKISVEQPQVERLQGGQIQSYSVGGSTVWGGKMSEVPSEQIATFESGGSMVAIPVTGPQRTAQKVYTASANNAAAATQTASAPVVVSAPTTNVSNSSTTVAAIPSRNNDSTLKQYTYASHFPTW